MRRKFYPLGKSLAALLFTTLLVVNFGCNPIAEEADMILESKNIYAELAAELENMQWEANDPSARNSKAIPSFYVTTIALQKLNFILPAVKDRATVLLATDEAYKAIDITPDNVTEKLELMVLIIANQVMSDQTYKGNELAGQTFTNMLGAPLSFSMNDGLLHVQDGFGNKANIIRTDWRAFNSTSHFIDTVLLPKF